MSPVLLDSSSALRAAPTYAALTEMRNTNVHHHALTQVLELASYKTPWSIFLEILDTKR
jgi:hypothetical protein